MLERSKNETPIKAGCYVCDHKFPDIIHCREHIIEEHRSGFDVSGESDFQYRSDLTFGDLEWVDENIWVLLREPELGAKWHRLHLSYHRVFPFSRRVIGVEGATIHTVYVAQCSPVDGDWRHVYIGHANNCLDSAYAQHARTASDSNSSIIPLESYLANNLFTEDPAEGLRWDLQFMLHDHEGGWTFPNAKVSLEVEKWLRAQLEAIGYLVGSDRPEQLAID